MVDFTDLSRVNQIYSELGQIEAALGNFDAGGKIVSMTVSGGEPTPPEAGQMPSIPRMSAMVSTVGWDYPDQMVTSIKGQLTARREALGQELADLGVTGDIPIETATGGTASSGGKTKR